MSQENLFAAHINHVRSIYDNALKDLAAEEGGPLIDGVMVHSGSEEIYFADDSHVPFKSCGHFNYWCPVLNRPDQMVLYIPGHTTALRRPSRLHYSH